MQGRPLRTQSGGLCGPAKLTIGHYLNSHMMYNKLGNTTNKEANR